VRLPRFGRELSQGQTQAEVDGLVGEPRRELPGDIGGQEGALQAWNHVRETLRVHQALGYVTPEGSYQQWLA
jgi:hypothetical protein